jgi:magnesium transporter
MEQNSRLDRRGFHMLERPLIATIFLPLTLVAGIYEMNFRVMLELEWVWGYPFALLVMLAVGKLLCYSISKKKKGY